VSTLNLLISFDAQKSNANKLIRGLSFKLALKFDWSSARITEDLRHDYGESRYLAIGYVDERLHVIVFTPREQKVHVISLRKANSRELAIYEQAKKT
jgi:uncharacterized DUF497 family protein